MLQFPSKRKHILLVLGVAMGWGRAGPLGLVGPKPEALRPGAAPVPVPLAQFGCSVWENRGTLPLPPQLERRDVKGGVFPPDLLAMKTFNETFFNEILPGSSV